MSLEYFHSSSLLAHIASLLVMRFEKKKKEWLKIIWECVCLNAVSSICIVSDFLYESPFLSLKASISQDCFSNFIFKWACYQYCESKYLLCCILSVLLILMIMKVFQKAECKIMFVSQLYLQDQYVHGAEESTTVFKCSDHWQQNCHIR